MSELQHRIRAAQRQAFGLDDAVREAVDALLDFACEARSFGDPDMSEAWDALFQAEGLIDKDWQLKDALRAARHQLSTEGAA